MVGLLLLCLGQDDVSSWAERLEADSIEARAEAERRLISAGERARPALERLARGEGEGALRAATLLRRLDYAGVLPPACGVELLNQLTSADPPTRRKALFEKLPGVTGNYGPPQAILAVALSDPDPSLRLEAALRSTDERAPGIAFDFLKRWSHPEFDGLRDAGGLVVDAGRRAAHESFPTAEILSLLASPSPAVRRAGVEMLHSLRRWEAAPAVREQLKGWDPELLSSAMDFLKAACALGEPGPYLNIIRRQAGWAAATAARVLVHLRARETAPELLTLALARRQGSVLLEAAADLDPEAGHAAALEVLSSVPPKDRYEPAYVDSAIWILARRPDPACFDVLLGGFKTLAEHPEGSRYGSFAPEELCGGLAACVPPDRIDDVLALARAPREVMLSGGTLGGGRDILAEAGAAILPYLDPRQVSRRLLARALDPRLKPDVRREAAGLFFWHGRELPAEDRPLLYGAVGDGSCPAEVRSELMRSLPWHDPGPARGPLGELAGRILADARHPLRGSLAYHLAVSQDPEMQGILLRAMEGDDDFPLPKRDYARWEPLLPPGESGRRAILRRLRSPRPEILLPVLEALDGCDSHLADLDLSSVLDSADPAVRGAAARLVEHRPHERYRGRARRGVADEADPHIVARWLGIAARLRDRPSLDLALRRDLPRGSASELARVRLLLALGTPEEVAPLEARLDELPPETQADAVAALARTEAASRVIRRAIGHASPLLRAAGACAIGEGRRAEFLPELRSMALADAQPVAAAAVRAARAFEKTRWLPLWREVLRWAPHALHPEILVREPVPELAPDLWRHLEGYGNEWGAALDACANAEFYQRWSGLKLERDQSLTLGSLVGFFCERGVPARLSPAAAEFADLHLGWAGNGAAGERLRALRWDGRYYGENIYYAHVSGPEGVTILTVPEAREYWAKRLGLK